MLRRVVKRVSKIAAGLYTYIDQAQYAGQTSGVMISQHSQLPTPTANALVALSTISTGTGDGFRQGNRVSLRRFYIKGYTHCSVGYDPFDHTEYPIGRILIWLVRDNDGQSLGSAGSNTDTQAFLAHQGVSNPILALLRPEYRKKIKILADIEVNLATVNSVVGSGLTAWGGRIFRWERGINLKKYIKGPTTYNGTTGTAGEQEQNHIYIAFFQQATITLAGSMVSYWNSRLSYDP